MVLGHSEILKLVEEKNLIENLPPKNIGGAGVDLRVGRVYKIKSSAKLLKNERVLPEIEELPNEIISLDSGEYLLIETAEKVNIPSNLVAWMLPRSTLQRSGVWLFTALIDPGFKGTLTFGIKNLGNQEFVFEKGARIAQIVFEKVEGKSKEYSGKYQGGKVV